MRVLVTGGTGFLGSHAVTALHAAGHQLRLLVRSPGKARELLASRGLQAAGIDLVQGDVVDAAAVHAALAGCDAVVHAAAVVGIDRSKARAIRATNVLGTRNVLGTAAALGLDPIVYVSSISALFEPGGPVLLTATGPVATSKNPYAQSKAASERYARELQSRGIPVVSVYPGGVLGPDDPGLSEAMRGAVIWRRLTMVDLDTGYLLVDVRDIAAVIVAAMTPGGGPKRYLAGHHYVPWRELCGLVAEVTGRPVLHPPIPAALLRGLGRAGDVVRRVIPFSFPLSREAMDTATLMVPMADQLTVDELNVEFRTVRQTLHDTYLSLYRAGRIPPRWLPALVNEQVGQ